MSRTTPTYLAMCSVIFLVFKYYITTSHYIRSWTIVELYNANDISAIYTLTLATLFIF